MEHDNGLNDHSIDCFFESNNQPDNLRNSNEFMQELYKRLERTSETNRVADQQDYSPASLLSSQNHNQYDQQEKMEEDQQEKMEEDQQECDDFHKVNQMDEDTIMAIDYVYVKCRSQKEEISGFGSTSTHCSSSQTNDSDNSFPSRKESKKRNKQNPQRNIPGLIGGKVRRSIIDFLNGDKSDKYQYLAEIFGYYNFPEQVVQKFVHLLRHQYSISKKTWEGVKENFKYNHHFRNLFGLCILGFLSNQGAADFNTWLKDGKMKDSREILFQKKEHIKKVFLSKFGL